jgi:hypothetical protein
MPAGFDIDPKSAGARRSMVPVVGVRANHVRYLASILVVPMAFAHTGDDFGTTQGQWSSAIVYSNNKSHLGLHRSIR